MIDSLMLDVFIGLSLVFLLYSLLATAILEILAQIFGLRNRMLGKAIRRMLCDDETSAIVYNINFFAFFWEMIRNLFRFFDPYFDGDNSFLKAFYQSPSIKYLSESSLSSKPSYLEPATFSKTVIYLLRGNSVTPSTNQMEMIRNTLYNTTTSSNASGFKIEKDTRRTLRNYYVDAAGDLDKFKVLLEQWFMETMDRSNGWYKKQSQVMLLLIGFIISFYYNIDAVKIYHVLNENSTIRMKVVDMTIKNKATLDGIVKAQSSRKTTNPDKAKADSIVRAQGPGKMTNTDQDIFDNYAEIQSQISSMDKLMGTGYEPGWPKFSIGFLLTAIAISLGANFWFDLLNKFTSLRASGNKPADERKSINNSDKLKRVG